MKIDNHIEKQFLKILTEEKIHPVYQPIVSLKDGSVFAYEALSRIDLPDCSFNTEEMFQIAENTMHIWDLEALCRKKALKGATEKPDNCKLFINVNPSIALDNKFKSGMTRKFLHKYGLFPDDIVFEITERTSIRDEETFQKAIQHYTQQNYQIAIDDFGTEYAGLNRIVILNPHYIKIDMNIIRNLHSDSIKHSLVKSLVIFCQDANIKLIAEGIETPEELSALIELGVDYGQGYYLKRPHNKFTTLNSDTIQQILDLNLAHAPKSYQPSFWNTVEHICHPEKTTASTTPGFAIFEYITEHPDVSTVPIIDENQHVLGVLTRARLMELFGGRYGYSLHSKKTANALMSKDFLVIDASTSIEIASKLSMIRPQYNLYDDVIVTKNNLYLGVVSVKDLLETAVSIQVTRAVDSNPLSGLPGNNTIEEKVTKCLHLEQPFAIAYLDLDNFKAYNDAYGFNNGDLMLKTLVRCLKNCCTNREFLGHIGGDDFVIISDYHHLEEISEKITQLFSASIQTLYSKEDWENGYIRSKNRNGFDDTFPIVTLSISIITNRSHNFASIDDFSKELVILKKKAKLQPGHSIQAI